MEPIQVDKEIKQIPNSIDEINKTDNEIVTIQCKVLFKRQFGKKLAFLSCLCEDDSEIEIMLKECKDYNCIKTSRVGNIYRYNGYHSVTNGKNHFVPLSIETIYEAKNSDELHKTRLIIQNSNLKPIEKKCLCKNYKNQKQCDVLGCPFRHFLLPGETDKLLTQKLKREEDLKKVHENDPINQESKLSKSQRNRLFADFLVETYGLDFLKSGTVFDIAGGKGLVSFYLTTVYSIKCLVIDPRGVELPKKQKQILRKSQLKIADKRIYFDENVTESLFIENSCVLMVGMHPDEATVPIVQIATKYKKNFAVVPCCVFPTKFPDRKLSNGDNVIEYTQLIKYIEELSPGISTAFLKIEGRNRILYRNDV